MNDNASCTTIYWTTDYKKFHYIHGNRDLNQTKINKLIKDVQDGLDLFKYCPILVNETYHIIDGQHRFFVCTKLKMNVYYVIVTEFSLAQIAKLNNNQNRWKMKDFLSCYIDAGTRSADYKILYDFIEKYKITISAGLSILYSGKVASGGQYLEMFRNGEFEVKFLADAEILMNAASEYAPYCDVNYNREFLSALQRLLGNGMFSQSEMIKKLHKNDLKIERKSNTKEYLAHMEELFNFKNSIRKTIY